MGRVRLLFVAAAVGCAFAAQTVFQHTGTTLLLGGLPFFVPPTPVSQIDVLAYDVLALVDQTGGLSSGFVPISVIPSGDTAFGDSALAATVQAWKEKDDVWSEAFLKGECLCTPRCDQRADDVYLLQGCTLRTMDHKIPRLSRSQISPRKAMVYS